MRFPQQRIANGIIIFLSFLGMGLSVYLVNVYAHIHTGNSAAGALCNLSNFLSCDDSARSAFADVFGIPLAALALGFYSGTSLLSIWALSRSTRDQHSVSPSLLLLILFSLSTLYSLFLATVSLGYLKTLCPGCLGLYAINVLGWIAAWRGYGRSPWEAMRSATRSLGAVIRYPMTWAFILTFIVGVASGQWFYQHTESSIVENQRMSAQLWGDSSTKSSPAEHSTQNEGTPINVDVRSATAPALGSANAPAVLVLFSDFQCSYCARFADVVHQVRDTFGERLRIEFRHFPLPFHSHAALYAKLAACADKKGRFWALHDVLFKQQKQVTPETMSVFLKQAGLDAQEILACAERDDIQSIVTQDQNAGKAAGVEGTPTFFINGRRYVGAYSREDLQRFVHTALTVPSDGLSSSSK